MNRFLLLLAIFSTTAAADAFVCVKDGKKTISDQPCEVIGGSASKQISTPTGSAPYTPNLKTQLENVRKNQQDLDARIPAPRPAATPTVNKTAECERNWEEMRAVDASARQSSQQWHRDRKKALQDERWNLGC